MASVPSTTTTPLHEPEAARRASDANEVERVALRVRESARDFARAPLSKKVAALVEVRTRLAANGLSLARLGASAKGILTRTGGFGEELLAGSVITQRYVRLLTESLQQIRERGAPYVGDERLRHLPSGEVAVQVMPHTLADRLLFMPYSIEARLERGVDSGDLRAAQASFYRQAAPEGSVAAVLGAGNVASIPALDVLHECFVAGRACVLKMSPVNSYLGPAFEHIFAPVSELGGLGIIYGGADAGKALLGSPHVDHVHMTGSIETHDAIVWGPKGPEREARLREDRPVLTKSITSELGNISPVVVVPGPYTDRELSDVAESIAGMLFNNASFNCNAVKLLVLPSSLVREITARLERLFAAQPARAAYYPGAIQRYQELTAKDAPGKLWAAPAGEGQLPWTLLSGLTPDSSAISFELEPFCPLLTVVELDEPDPEQMLDRAVTFLNEKVWGTLNAMLVVPRALEGEAGVEAALARAIDDLRYGTVAVNYWPAIGYGTGTPPWGGHPSSTLKDAQSGIGFVHNALMLERINKVVLRGPLRSFPKQFYYPSHQRLEALARGLFEFESTGKLLPLLSTGISGVAG